MVGCEKESINPSDVNYSISSEKAKEKSTNNKSVIVTITEDNFEDFIHGVNINLEANTTFIDDFLSKSENSTLTEQDLLTMLDILNISTSSDVSNLDSYNLANNVYGLIGNHIVTNPSSKTKCDKLVEIRNALLSECDNYIWGIDQTCKGAVMIAYWYKSDGC